MAGQRLHADIFCRVVDNFGDIGVCWRLARRLAHGHGWTVRLWVDDMASFARLEPRVAQGDDSIDGVRLIAWGRHAPDFEPGDVVIEAFACDPPPAFVARLTPRQVWLNLEYLSAEAWIESCHALPSPQAGGLIKYFWFPGFTSATGGLLREPGLLRERDAFQADGAARAAFLCDLGLAPALSEALAASADTAADAAIRPSDDAATAPSHAAPAATLTTLFCYPDAPASGLLRALATRSGLQVLALAGGSAPQLAEGRHGSVHVVRLPFVSQAAYDRLLWSAHLNCVRGEDSFVRAQWAARPMLWHIYPQEAAAHVDKLEAWLARLPAPPFVADLHRAWNGAAHPTAFAGELGRALAPNAFAAWARSARNWAARLARQGELADGIAEFCLDKVK